MYMRFLEVDGLNPLQFVRKIIGRGFGGCSLFTS